MTKTNQWARHRKHLEAVLTNTGTCILGCLDAQEHPSLIPVLYDYADGGVYLVALEQAGWCEHLLRDERVALYISGGALHILIQGHAQQVAEPLYMRRLLDRSMTRLPQPVSPGGRTQPSEHSMGSGSFAASPEQGLAKGGLNRATWFFVHFSNVFLQQGGAWIRLDVASIRGSAGPHTD
jgi:nitroimidazol reductase NimA-like FMN-containing flavoprotein (pyridoxamine 5'-phosphate oxidase superfamily)